MPGCMVTCKRAHAGHVASAVQFAHAAQRTLLPVRVCATTAIRLRPQRRYRRVRLGRPLHASVSRRPAQGRRRGKTISGELAPKDNDVPAHTLKVDIDLAEPMPYSRADFRAEVSRRGFEHASDVFAEVQKTHPELKIESGRHQSLGVRTAIRRKSARSRVADAARSPACAFRIQLYGLG